MRSKTSLEFFLEKECGMAPPRLVEHYETHRDFIESGLKDLPAGNETWEEFAARAWLLLPDLPNWWLIT